MSNDPKRDAMLTRGHNLWREKALAITAELEAKADGMKPEDVDQLTDEQAMVATYGEIFRFYSEAGWKEPERREQRCGWCIRAAGDKREAWEAAEVYIGDSALVDHVLHCEHNPLGAVARVLRDAAEFLDGRYEPIWTEDDPGDAYPDALRASRPHTMGELVECMVAELKASDDREIAKYDQEAERLNADAPPVDTARMAIDAAQTMIQLELSGIKVGGAVTAHALERILEVLRG